MTTTPVPTITDEQIAEIEAVAEQANARGLRSGLITPQSTLLALIARIRAAEKDSERLNKLDAIGYAYGFEDMHEGNRWMIDGPYRNIRAAIDDMTEAKP